MLCCLKIGRGVIELFQTNALLIGKIKTCKEVHLDYMPLESNIFHFGRPDSLRRLFGRSGADASYPAEIGRRLATVCITLNEHPNIRYQASSQFAHAIADTVHRYIQDYKRDNSTFRVNGDDTGDSDRSRAQLLILDRTFDPLSPFMHEYSYQAMANDLLQVDSRGMVTYTISTEGGAQEEKEAILNSETDELWKEHRHKHIAHVITSVKERMSDILATNKLGKRAKKKEDMEMSEMAQAVQGLSEYKQIMSNLGRHVSLAKQCMNEFTALGLMDISALEQSMSTGVDDTGNEFKGRRVFEALLPVMQNKKVKSFLKLRLLAIYSVSQRPLVQTERGQLITAAKLSGDDQQVLTNLESLMGAMDSTGAATASTAATAAKAGGGGGSFLSRLLGGRREAEVIEATAEGEYTDTRHVCQMRILLEQLLRADLPLDRYPSMGPALPTSAAPASTAQSVRKFKSNDRWGGKAQAQVSGGRVIVFVAGGLCYSEMREATELMIKESKEIVIGTTHVSSPSAFIEEVAGLEESA